MGITAGTSGSQPTTTGSGTSTAPAPVLTEEQIASRKKSLIGNAVAAFDNPFPGARNQALSKSIHSLNKLEGNSPLETINNPVAEVGPRLELAFSTIGNENIRSDVFTSLREGGRNAQQFDKDLRTLSSDRLNTRDARDLQSTLSRNRFSFVRNNFLSDPEKNDNTVLFNQGLLTDYLNLGTGRNADFNKRLDTVEKAFGGDSEAQQTISGALGFSGAGGGAKQTSNVVGEVDVTGEEPRKEKALGNSGGIVKLSTLIGES